VIRDLSAALATAAAAAVASGGLTGDGGLSADPGLAAGTWRPVPPEAGGSPGSYATTLPFVLAHRLAADPARVAAVLAAALRSILAEAEISDISVTGDGYLSLTLTPDTLARLAVRISQAGPGCARSQAMDGVRVSAPRDTRLAGARDWADAWQRLTAEQGGRLAEAAGAEVTWVPLPPEANAPGECGLVAEAVAYAGEDAVRFALSEHHHGRARQRADRRDEVKPLRLIPAGGEDLFELVHHDDRIWAAGVGDQPGRITRVAAQGRLDAAALRRIPGAGWIGGGLIGGGVIGGGLIGSGSFGGGPFSGHTLQPGQLPGELAKGRGARSEQG